MTRAEPLPRRAATRAPQAVPASWLPGPETVPGRSGDQDGRSGPRVAVDFAQLPVTPPPVRPGLILSSPGDASEQEADRVADDVVRGGPSGAVGAAPAQVQRACSGCQEHEDPMPVLSRQALAGHEEDLELPEVAVQRQVAPGTAVAGVAPLAGRLAGTQSGGEPLGAGPRRSMETAFGRDFSGIRVHRDGDAASLSRRLGALAFTRGSHIYFGSGMYDPEKTSGRHLLAHELTHVVQQGRAGARSGGTRPVAHAAPTGPPTVQRVATWAAPTVHEINNLADTGLFGADAGVTLPTLNGAVGGAVNAPTVTVSAAPTGGFDATVTAVAANTGSADETVLAAGPWRRVVPRSTVGAQFPTLTQCTGAANANFRARGKPSDAAMAAANRRHEDHHAADGRAAFNGSIVPWDARLTAALTAGTTIHGGTAAAARAALFAAMGGTPTQVGNANIAAWNAAIPVYHATAAGGPIGAPTDPSAAADCSWAFARYTNPS